MSIQISLQEPLDERAAEAARRLGITVEEFVRRAVDDRLKTIETRQTDPFFSDAAVFDGPDDGVTDVAENHDHYLYDVDPHGGSS